MKAQYAILRFAKYKGPTVSRIEAHNDWKAAINIRKSNNQEIRRIFRRISFDSMKQEDIAYEA